MLTDKQLAARKIGGSDVATILGVNPYKTARELYHEKRGELEVPNIDTNDAVEAGNVMEAPIAELVQRRLTRRWAMPVKLRKCNLTLSRPEFPWLTVHIDRDFVGLERGLEIKNVGPRAWKGWGPEDSDEIPEHYLPQVHTYLLVKQYPVWTVAGYFGGGDLRFYEIQRDPEMDELIVTKTEEFWNAVAEGIPPDVDPAGPRAVEVLRKVYPGTNGQTVEAPPELLDWLGTYKQAGALKRDYAEMEERAKAHVLRVMGEAAILHTPVGDYTRKIIHRKAYTVEEGDYVRLDAVKAAK